MSAEDDEERDRIREAIFAPAAVQARREAHQRAEQAAAEELQKYLGPGLGIGVNLHVAAARHDLVAMLTDVRLAFRAPDGLPKGQEVADLQALNTALRRAEVAMKKAEEAWFQKFGGYWTRTGTFDSTTKIIVGDEERDVHAASLFAGTARRIETMIAMTSTPDQGVRRGKPPSRRDDRALDAICVFFLRWSRDERTGSPMKLSSAPGSHFTRFAGLILDRENGEAEGPARRTQIERAVQRHAAQS